MYANIFLIGNISSRTNIAAKFGPGPNMAAIFGPTGQNMDATFGPRADIIWHGRTEYGSHILSGRTKYGSHIWSRTKFGSHNRSAGQFLGRTFCAVTYHEVNTIKASSPRLNHLAYIGCYMIVLASLVYTAMEVFLLGHGLGTVMCNVFPWFVMLGFTLVFGTVLVKRGRLYFIFKSSLNLQRTPSVVVRDYTLTFIVIVFALVGAVLFTVWSIFDASVRIYVRKPTGTSDGNLEVRIKGQCSSKYQLNFIAAIVAYLAVLIMCCVVLAISNRTIKWKEFKSNGVILLVYMLVLTNGTCGGVYYVVWYAAFDNAIAYAMLSLMLAANVYLCIGLLFAPPVTPVFLQLWRDLLTKMKPHNLLKKQVEFSTTSSLGNITTLM